MTRDGNCIVTKDDVTCEATIVDRDREMSLYLTQHVGTFEKDGAKYDLSSNGATMFIIEREGRPDGAKRLAAHVDIRKALNAALVLLIEQEKA